MAFNPYAYQNPYYQPPVPDQLAQLRAPYQPQPVVQTPPQQSGIVWVGSEAEAHGYLVAPNCAVALWDANSPSIYLKQADAAGKPSFKAFDLVERTAAPKTAPVGVSVPVGDDYVTRQEFDSLRAEIARLSAKESKPTKKTVKEEEEDG